MTCGPVMGAAAPGAGSAGDAAACDSPGETGDWAGTGTGAFRARSSASAAPRGKDPRFGVDMGLIVPLCRLDATTGGFDADPRGSAVGINCRVTVNCGAMNGTHAVEGDYVRV